MIVDSTVSEQPVLDHRYDPILPCCIIIPLFVLRSRIRTDDHEREE